MSVRRSVMLASVVFVLRAAVPLWAAESSCLVRIAYDADVLPLTHETVDALVQSSGVLGAAAQPFDDVWRRGQEAGLPFGDMVTASFCSVPVAKSTGPAGFQPRGGRGMVGSAGGGMPQGPAGLQPRGGPGMFVPGRMGMPQTPGPRSPYAEPGSLLGRLTIQVDDGEVQGNAKAIANGLLKGVCERLAVVLRDAGEFDRSVLQERWDSAKEEAERARSELADISERQAALCEQAGRFDLQRDMILHDIQLLESQRDSLTMALAAQEARQRALTDKVAQIGQKVKASVQKDAVVAELEKVLELRKVSLARVQQLVDAGRASESDLQGEYERVALARAEVAKQQRAASEATGGKMLANLNQELTMLSVDAAEKQEQLNVIRTRLEQIRERRVLELADEYEREVMLTLPLVRQTVQDATFRVRELEGRLRAHRSPSMVVLGGVSDEE